MTTSEARNPVPAAVIASAAALAAAKIGHDSRRGLDRRFPDPVVALAEDGLAIGLAALGSCEAGQECHPGGSR
jgi:hypothetical protein